MAPVEGRDALDAEALSDRDERGVGSAEAEAGVTLGEIGHAHDISVGQLGRPQAAGPKVP